ncbi:MAG: vWA domain-containing protein, partial [Candidatus Saccharibacteria bacterium]|nr:vWA domain-containing protein [Candidatus Saccharibacteria bacterium]
TEGSDNTVSIVSFGTNAQIDSHWSKDKEALKNIVDTFDSYASDITNLTNYYDAFVKANELLAEYNHSDDRNTVIVFLTDGLPCHETPKQVAEYASLKENYPYVIVNAIQYEMGPWIMDSIEEVSDRQFVAEEHNVADVILDASMIHLNYEDLNITDYINGNYFEFDQEAENNITTSYGTAEYNGEGELEKISWDVSSLPSGRGATLTFKIKLKETAMYSEDFLPTNNHETILANLPETPLEEVSSEETPVLKSAYRVYYQSNTDGTCSAYGMPSYSEVHHVFETVAISTAKPTCKDHNFAGFRMASEGVGQFNDDYFVMPEEDVYIRATWSKISIDKTMDGETVNDPQKLYDVIASRSKGKANGTDTKSATYINYGASKPSETSGVYEYSGTGAGSYANPVYFERGEINDNNIIFGGFCWYVIRTTETGGVKLLYNGTPNEAGYCRFLGASTDATIGKTQYNQDGSGLNADKKKLGYMYGNSEARWNLNDVSSTAKTFIENWYANNLTDYTSYLENTIWCNDRVYTEKEWYPGTYSAADGGIFGANNRLYGTSYGAYSYPSLFCSRAADKFTAKNMPDNGGGNAMLEYPVAMLTADEYTLIGMDLHNTNNTDKYYAYGPFTWTLSPYSYYHTIRDNSTSNSMFISGPHLYSGRLVYVGQIQTNYVRPSVSLKPNTYVIGNGTYEKPWRIVTP